MNKKKKKQYLIVGNWKMYLSFYESVSFCSINQQQLKNMAKKQQLVFLPSFVAINAVSALLKETMILWGAQDCSEYENGAYTGEISASMLESLNCSFCLVGHSERRIYFGEDDEKVAKKYTQLIQGTVQPIVCIGELEKQKTIQEAKKIVKKQLAFLSKIQAQKKLYIAYEPAWAITKKGKSNPAEPDFVAEMIEYISLIMLKFWEREHFEDNHLMVLYGASVDETNIADYASIPSIKGFLLGASSTKIESLASIVDSLSE